jgi:DNA-binding LacI/PurR family transcriptional regulator
MSESRTTCKHNDIAQKLKNDIKSKKLTGKLPGERMIAKWFQVHHITASKAIKTLENEGFVFRIPGKGTYIKPSRNISKALEIYLFAFYVNETNQYLNNVLNIIEPQFISEGFNVFKRVTSFLEEREVSWDIELNRISSMKELDAMLIFASSLNRKEIKDCLNLPYPTIFIGDFKSGRMDDIEFNQITGNNSVLGRNCMEFLIKNGHGSIALITGSLQHFFNKEYLQGVQEATHDGQPGIDVYELPGALSLLSLEEREKIIRKTLSPFFKKTKNYDALLVSGVAPEYVKSALSSKLKFPEDMSILCSTDNERDFSCLKFHYDLFGKMISKRIKELSAGDTSLKKQFIEWPISIVDNGTLKPNHRGDK